MPNQPKERPILFSTPMVQAILEGRKTMTRRIVKQKITSNIVKICYDGADKDFFTVNSEGRISETLKCPYGTIGDRLWVRETFRPVKNSFDYKADFQTDGTGKTLPRTWKPSIFMPRSASRITLEIVNVRVERLQEISRGDCMSEGCPFPNVAKEANPKDWYMDLWNTINGKGSWEKNPWVWVVEFKRI